MKFLLSELSKGVFRQISLNGIRCHYSKINTYSEQSLIYFYLLVFAVFFNLKLSSPEGLLLTPLQLICDFLLQKCCFDAKSSRFT